ncbi:MAG TPA: plastocyanin/azurin family copper-binding protein [Gracilimonas sp.]|uniref:cupredoxin domain-containing protein n=1 Tax=Gracilimonas sp. TaxID=1974203 RepID=UPI002D815F8F|nr:plastocyanin/azurin family copper-binding protein [Gracilimonas sp.]
MKLFNVVFLIFVFGISFSTYALPTDTLTVKVLGTAEDARFEPVVLQVQPGDVIRFEVVEGLHTVTAYHPDNRRPQRIPETAQSFDSGMLTSGQTWFLTLDEAGMYDYFCLPHERMGHAGRILVGEVKEIPDYPVGSIPGSIIEMLNRETEKLLP